MCAYTQEKLITYIPLVVSPVIIRNKSHRATILARRNFVLRRAGDNLAWTFLPLISSLLFLFIYVRIYIYTFTSVSFGRSKAMACPRTCRRWYTTAASFSTRRYGFLLESFLLFVLRARAVLAVDFFLAVLFFRLVIYGRR